MATSWQMQVAAVAEVTGVKADWLPGHDSDSDSDVEILDVDLQTPNPKKVTSSGCSSASVV